MFSELSRKMTRHRDLQDTPSILFPRKIALDFFADNNYLPRNKNISLTTKHTKDTKKIEHYDLIGLIDTDFFYDRFIRFVQQDQSNQCAIFFRVFRVFRGSKKRTL